MLDKTVTSIAAEIRDALQNEQILLSREAFIVFVCGARSNPEKPCARDSFMNYARKHLAGYEFFLAEDYFDRASSSTDLLSTEGEIAKFADCLLVMVESESAIAELGAFANDDSLSRIMLVVNNIKYQNSGSFIARGPIAKINNTSVFRPVIHANLDTVLTSVGEIESRLAAVRRKRNVRITSASHTPFDARNRKTRLLFLYELISIFGPVSHQELVEILHVVFSGKGSGFDTELGLLQTLELVSTTNSYLYPSPNRLQHYFVFQGVDIQRARSTIVGLHFRRRRDRFSILSQAAIAGTIWER